MREPLLLVIHTALYICQGILMKVAIVAKLAFDRAGP
jgi:hypothetical protein